MLCHASNTPWRLQALGLGIPPRQPPSSRECEWDEMLQVTSEQQQLRKYFFTPQQCSQTQDCILRCGLHILAPAFSQIQHKIACILLQIFTEYAKYFTLSPHTSPANIEQEEHVKREEHARHVSSSFVFVSSHLLFIILETQTRLVSIRSQPR